MMLLVCFVALPVADAQENTDQANAKSPYPPSPVIESITWHWDTYQTAAPGSDLWPVTWAADGDLYAAWGDGGGFGGTDWDGRVAMGFARIEGPPESFVGTNVNGGKNPTNPASFRYKGKTGGILAVGKTLYALLNTQDAEWPNVDFRLIWSSDQGATWQTSTWAFPKGQGKFKPGTFLNFGPDYTRVPASLRGYVYFYGGRQGDETKTFMGRVRQNKLQDRAAYQFLRGLTADNKPIWGSDINDLMPIFEDSRGGGGAVAYDPALKRYLLTSFHGGPGQLGIFDAPQPWGPWTTVAYYEDWGKMGAAGEGLTCDFPQKWQSADGLTAWCVFSVYGAGAQQGIDAHDRFNLVKTTLKLVERSIPTSQKGL
jgi:hypothetical protein